MGKGGFTPEERAKSRDSQKRTIAAQKAAMLKSLSEHYCVVKYAAKEVGIDRGTHARWMEKDGEYRDAVMRLQEENIDIAENALMKAIEKGDNVFLLGEVGVKVLNVDLFSKLKDYRIISRRHCVAGVKYSLVVVLCHDARAKKSDGKRLSSTTTTR